MLCGTYRFHGTFIDDATLPESKGALFRGTFGTALRQVVCAMKQKDCAGCILDRRCLYTLLFSSPPPATHCLLPPFPRGRIRTAHIPPPFVIEPPETRATAFRRGDPFDFGLILFGRSNEHLVHFIQAFEEMGRLGVGRRSERGRSRFVVATVAAGGGTVWDGRDRLLREGDFAENLAAALPGDPGGAEAVPVSALTLCLETPLLGVAGAGREKTLDFTVLLRAVLDRMIALCRNYGKGDPGLDSPGLLRRAGAVRVAASNLRRAAGERPPRRGSPTQPGGLTGEVTYEGALGGFLPLLRFCERAHLGEGTSWGAGRIRIAGVE